MELPSLGQALMFSRQWAELDCAQLAEKADLSPAAIAAIESGNGADVDTVVAISRALGVPLVDLMNEDPDAMRELAGLLIAERRSSVCAVGTIDEDDCRGLVEFFEAALVMGA